MTSKKTTTFSCICIANGVLFSENLAIAALQNGRVNKSHELSDPRRAIFLEYSEIDLPGRKQNNIHFLLGKNPNFDDRYAIPGKRTKMRKIDAYISWNTISPIKRKSQRMLRDKRKTGRRVKSNRRCCLVYIIASTLFA